MPTIATTSGPQLINITDFGEGGDRDENLPAAAALPGGAYAVAWQSGPGAVVERVFTAEGDTLGPQVTFATGSSYDPAVAALGDGGFVITWEAANPQDFSFDIYAQRFSSFGSPVGSSTRVNTTTEGHQINPDVAALADGRHVVVWGSGGNPGVSNAEIFARQYDSSGAPLGGESLVTPIPGDASDASVAALAGGGYAISYTLVTGSERDVFAQRFTADGDPIGFGPTRVNTTTEGSQNFSSIAGLSNGGYVVTWNSDDGVFAQRFSAAGRKIGSETQVVADPQIRPTVEGMPDGGYVVTWSSSQGPAAGTHFQRFDGSGAPVGVDVWVDPNNAPPPDYLAGSAAAALTDGRLLVLYSEDYSGDAPETGLDVYARTFGPFTKGATLSTDFEIAVGDRGDNTFLASPGALDSQFPWRGDQIYGEAGYDRIRLTEPGVLDTTGVYLSSVEEILGSKGADTFFVNAGLNVGVIDGAGGDDTVEVFGNALNLVGTALRKIEHVTTTDPNGTAFTVDSVATALLIEGGGAHDTVTATALTFEESQLRKLYNNGVEEVIDASGSHHAPAVSMLTAANVGVPSVDGVAHIDASDNGALAATASAPPIRGTSGPDTIAAPNVSSEIRGLAGDDRLFGGAGDDFISGGAGNDFVQGPVGGGSDTLVGDGGDDSVFAGDGDDELLGGAGNDLLNGYYGDDLLKGGAGNDDLFGDTYPNAFAGNDTLVGGGGDDTLRGSLGDDVLSGGPGADVYRFEGPGGGIPTPGFDHDTIRDFQPGEDRLIFELFGPLTFDDLSISVARGDTFIDLSAYFGQPLGTHMVTLLNVTTITAADVFVF